MDTIIIKNIDEINCPYCGYEGSDLKIGWNPIGIDNLGILNLRCSKCKEIFIIKHIVDPDKFKVRWEAEKEIIDL